MRTRLRLVEGKALSPSVRSLVFEVEPSGAFSYEPGQALDLFVPTAGGLVNKRPYSIASAPGCAGERRLELAVTRVPTGATSLALHALAEGALLQAEAPRGGFVRWPAERDVPSLFVATGSGLAPLRAMLQAEFARTDGPPVSLLFGCRTLADVLWAEELARWQREHPRFSLVTTLSRPHPTWTGCIGYVQHHIADCVAAHVPARVFVCGLSLMVDAVARALEEAGVASSSIRMEEYDL
jgi:CDP-4-dehydro-6-deoxyglucose reductase